MTELKLYKFITENNIEYHWYDNEIYMFVNIYLIEEFNKLFTSDIFDDGGIPCTMKNGYFGFKMIDICEYYNIEPENIFINKEN